MECWRDDDSLFRFDVEGPDHLAPFLGFVGDELTDVRRRAREYCAAQVGKSRLELGIAEARVDLLVELLDDLNGRALGRAEADPGARLVARHKFAHGRDVRQYLRTRCGSYCERAQPTIPDILDRRDRGGKVDLHLPTEQIGERGPAATVGHMNHVD